ncbi:MAG TPA: UDP-glucose/GDP-mannose dehydrogenase family protein, partial [Mycobacteriales bacterium]|nr:UDP-glucose/GDP-mannose dehydrogenase family protein [Mycobacteriales bacterium]
RQRALDLATELAGGSLAGVKVGVLGATFKPNSDDVRDSPALAITAMAHQAGAVVTVYDPQGTDNARRALPDVAYASSLDEAADGAEVVLLLTEWEEFRHVEPLALAEVVARTRIVDGRNCLDPAVWRAAGWELRLLGRP